MWVSKKHFNETIQGLETTIQGLTRLIERQRDADELHKSESAHLREMNHNLLDRLLETPEKSEQWQGVADYMKALQEDKPESEGEDEPSYKNILDRINGWAYGTIEGEEQFLNPEPEQEE